MRKMNKKGFTIVELVIVIAVIAILSAVLIPTFSGVVANAEKTAAVSDAKAAYQQYLVATAEKGTEEDLVFVYEYKTDMLVILEDGEVKMNGKEKYFEALPTGYTKVVDKVTTEKPVSGTATQEDAKGVVVADTVFETTAVEGATKYDIETNAVVIEKLFKVTVTG